MILKNQGRTEITISTIYGKITYKRTVLIPLSKKDADVLYQLEQKKSIVPLDNVLGVDKHPFKATPGYLSAVSRISISATSYENAVKDVLKECNVPTSSAEIERITNYVGKMAFDLQKKAALAAMEPDALKLDKRRRRKQDNDRLYLMLDGAMLHYRDIPNKGSGWGECKCALSFHSKDIKYFEKKTKDGKEYRILKMDHMGFIGTAEDFISHFIAFAHRNGCKVCSEVVIVVDGALWIYKFLEKYFPYAIIILDKWHAKENAWKFANAVHNKPELQQKLGQHLCDLIDQGATEQILQELKKYDGKKMKVGVPNFYTYTKNHQKYMKYPEYERKEIIVGSGAMESSHRYTLQNRLKGAGMRWNINEAQYVLTLKKKEASGKWYEIEEMLEG